jgi:hypothetical protein
MHSRCHLGGIPVLPFRYVLAGEGSFVIWPPLSTADLGALFHQLGEVGEPNRFFRLDWTFFPSFKENRSCALSLVERETEQQAVLARELVRVWPAGRVAALQRQEEEETR